MISNQNYYLEKNKNTDEVIYFEYDTKSCYEINPKAKKKNAIEVNKIVFVKPELSEKIIRRKIDKKIAELLKNLKDIDSDDSDEGSIKRSLMDAEKLRIQIINNYVKYLGHTYESLTLKKIQIIINELRYKLFTKKEYEIQEQKSYYDEKSGRRGR